MVYHFLEVNKILGREYSERILVATKEIRRIVIYKSYKHSF